MKKKILLLLLLLLPPLLIIPTLSKKANQRGCYSPGITVSKEVNIYPGKEEIRVLILGDTGTGNAHQKRVADAAEKTCQEAGCDMAILLGDNFYPNGVKNVEDSQFIDKFESIYKVDIPFYAILGNHDKKGNWKAQIEYSNKSSRWVMPDVKYRFTAGAVTFYGINTNCMYLPSSVPEIDSDTGWNVVMGHHPLISSGDHSNINLGARYLMEREKMDFYLSGHQHLLEHLQKDSYDQIVSGGGGGYLQKTVKAVSPYSKFLSHTYGYVWARFTTDSARFIYYDDGGKELYSFERKR